MSHAEAVEKTRSKRFVHRSWGWWVIRSPPRSSEASLVRLEGAGKELDGWGAPFSIYTSVDDGVAIGELDGRGWSSRM